MTSFADYVKDVMAVLPTVNGNPMLSVTSQEDYNKYREDPFYKSRAIKERDKLALEEKEKLKKEEEAERAEAAEMVRYGSGTGPSLDPAVEAFLDAENSGVKGGRNVAALNLAGSLVTGRPMGEITGWLGMEDSMGGTSAGRIAQQAYQYGKTPAFLRGLLPESYANAYGFMEQSNSLFGPMNTNGPVTMGKEQAAMLASQDKGLFENPQERGAWYAANSHNNSGGVGGQDGRGGQTDSAMTGYTE